MLFAGRKATTQLYDADAPGPKYGYRLWKRKANVTKLRANSNVVRLTRPPSAMLQQRWRLRVKLLRPDAQDRRGYIHRLCDLPDFVQNATTRSNPPGKEPTAGILADLAKEKEHHDCCGISAARYCTCREIFTVRHLLWALVYMQGKFCTLDRRAS